MTRAPLLTLLALTMQSPVVQAQAPASAERRPADVPAAAATEPPPDYVIGSDDVLTISFWRDRDMSADVTVRPDGKISLPLLDEIQAAGLTPAQLRLALTKAAKRFIEEPNATVVVREIRSRKVFITGNVARPASYPLNTEMDVLQLIALAGGVLEYADAKHIVVVRKTAGGRQTFTVNYNEIVKRRNMAQNIGLKPGDTVVVP